MIASGPSAGAIEPDGCGTVVVPSAVGSSDVPAPAASLHPVLANSSLVETQLYDLLYRPVLWINPEHQIDPVDSLASSVKAADGGATFRITLKPYVWSDGAPVTADDVLYCWEMIKEDGPSFVNYQTGGIPQLVRSVTVTGAHTLEIRLTRAVNPDWFEITGIQLLFALPRHAWGHLTIKQQQSLQSTTSFYGVVDGPFRLDRLEVGRYAAFSPNPLYGGHKASMRRLLVTFLQGTDPLAALQAGQVDMASLPFSVWEAARKLPGFDLVSIGPSAQFTTIVPNLASPSAPFLADLRVRQAMAMAVDQQRLVASVFHGNSLVDRGFIPTALDKFLSPEIRGGRTPIAFDPTRAMHLLDQAGWRPGPRGIRGKDGHLLSFEVLTTAGDATGLTMLELIRSDLASVGIELRIKETEFNQLLARMAGSPAAWQAAFLSWSMTAYPDGTQQYQTGSFGNYEHYSSPAMDRLLDAAIYNPGMDGLFALENYILEQQPMIFLPTGFYTVMVRPGIDGVRKFISPSGTWSPEYLTLHGAMACH